jgi:DHA1 family inner membrane transport protein
MTGTRLWLGMPIPVLALTMCAFCIGTAEFVVMGLLPDIARDLGVSIPLAGQVVTAYALGVTVGAPLLAVATARMPRKKVILLSVVIFIVGNALSAVAPGYVFLIVARVIAAFAHGTMFGVGAVVAASVVPPGKRASAIGLMFTGLTLANILGVPFGTFVGQGLGWRATFWFITGLGVIALVPVALFIPFVKADPSANLGREFAVLRRGSVLLALSTTVFASASVFVLFTYIVPILQDVSGFAPRQITPILLMIGVGLTIGITLGGRFSDRGVMRAMILVLAALTVALLLMPPVLPYRIPTLAMVFLWSMLAFGGVPAFQSRVVDQAADAPNLASTINIGAFNLGNAGGALLGGLVIDRGFGLQAVPVAAAAVAAIAALTAIAGAARDRQVKETRC